MLKIDGSLARNIDFEVEVPKKTRRKTLILRLQNVKNWRKSRTLSMGEAAKPLLFEGFQAGCHVVLRGRRGTL